MAVNSLIHFLNQYHISATVELPDGKWCHSQEYLALRLGGIRRLTEVLFEAAMSGNGRAKLQYALLKEQALEQVQVKLDKALAEVEL